MKWLSDQLVFKSNNNFPVNPYVDFPEDKKNNKQKEGENIGQSLNNTETSLKSSNNNNENNVENINSTAS